MKRIAKFLSVMLCIILAAGSLFGCSKVKESTPVEPENFRVTAYVVAGGLNETFDSSNLSRLTDVILFGNATFDEEGNVVLSDTFDQDVAFLRELLTDQNFYLNILGPSSQSESDDWNEQMYDLADRHTSAFKSGKLEDGIKDVLDKYGFDGVVFDYEFPLRDKDWRAYDKFIVRLNKTLGDEYKIGMSMVGWNLNQSKRAMKATDFFEIMSYDLWDDDGYHATMEIAQNDIDLFVENGYDKAKLDLGVPFYARPTNKEALWSNYKDYYEELSDDGLCVDEETGYTLSFNTYELIKQKTEYALDNGVGGMMVWHYSCDVPADDEKSLFGAIDSAKCEAVAKQ